MNRGASAIGTPTRPTVPPGTVIAMLRRASPLSTSYTARRTSVTIVPLEAQSVPRGLVQREWVSVAFATTTVADASVSSSADIFMTSADAVPAPRVAQSSRTRVSASVKCGLGPMADDRMALLPP